MTELRPIPTETEDAIVITFREEGLSPEILAKGFDVPVSVVQAALLKHGCDWAKPGPSAGRPTKHLLAGQARYAETAYTKLSLSQAAISAKIGAPVPRVRRHLLDRNLLEPGRVRRPDPERNARLLAAVKMYIEEAPIEAIVETTGIHTPALYTALRARNIPTRLQPKGD